LPEREKRMIKLHQLKKHPKSTHRKKVVGRGLGSGHGTYSTRGGKGQTARTGHSKLPAGFEGGRQPLIRQVPKSRGFRALDAKAIAVSIDKLNAFNDGDTVTVQALKDKAIIDVMSGQSLPRVKLLGGKLSKKLTVKIPASASATTAIEKAGGSVIKK
jgi:large subunit ribosomal protein L15